MSAVDVGMKNVEVSRVSFGDVGEGVARLLRQLTLIEERMEEVAVLLLGKAPDSSRAVARLNLDWSMLEAWLEFLSSAETTPDAVARLWALSPLASVRDRLRRLLQQGAACGRDPNVPRGLLAQLFRLATKLKAHEDLLTGLLEGPGHERSTVNAMCVIAGGL